MLDVIKNRKSVRLYQDKEIEEEKLNIILEAARISPSGSNRQPWQIIVVRSKETREMVAKTCHNQRWMQDAPIQLICVADEQAAKGTSEFVDEKTDTLELKRAIRDTAIMVSHIMLEAVHQGLDTCWIGLYTQEELRPVLGVPEDKYILGVIPIGYEADDHKPLNTKRKDLSEIIRQEKW